MRAILCLLWMATAVWAGPREDWEKIVALDAGPGVQPKTVEEAKSISLGHTEKQEKALRAFLAAYARDERAFEARLRLARLVILRADLRGEPIPAEAAKLLGEAEAQASGEAQRAEVDFARIAQRMRQSRGKRPTVEERRSLLEAARTFEREHPGDRRIGPLLAEIATLFDGDVQTKERLLKDAKKLTKDPDVLAQIADDLKRLSWLGKPLPLKFTGLDGARIDVKDWRGKPVLVVFFATWSEPSRTVFAQMQQVATETGAGFVGVSLDADAGALTKFLAAQKSRAAVAWDGKGWESPLAQALGVNSVPSAWLLDKRGVVRSLDALEAPEEMVREAGK
jgi:thiol-disulfide isomerase/thioredoxin